MCSTKMFENNNKNFYVYLDNKKQVNNPLQIGNFPNDFYSDLNLVLSNDYSVGVVEISFKKNWKNIRDEEAITLKTEDNTYKETLYLPPANYDQIEDFIFDLNGIFNSFKTKNVNITRVPELIYNKFNRKIIIRCGKYSNESNIIPIFSQTINKILGFDNNYENSKIMFNQLDKSIRNRRDDIPGLIYLIGSRSYKLPQINHFILYSNIVKPSIHKNKSVHLLAKIKIPSNIKYNETVVLTVDNPVFHRIGHTEISNILIQIFDEKQRFINFEPNNNIVINLEFKKDERELKKSLFELLFKTSR